MRRLLLHQVSAVLYQGYLKKSTFLDAYVKNSVIQPEVLEVLGLILSLKVALLTFPNQE
jgi:hypothetical protein